MKQKIHDWIFLTFRRSFRSKKKKKEKKFLHALPSLQELYLNRDRRGWENNSPKSTKINAETVGKPSKQLRWTEIIYIHGKYSHCAQRHWTRNEYTRRWLANTIQVITNVKIMWSRPIAIALIGAYVCLPFIYTFDFGSKFLLFANSYSFCFTRTHTHFRTKQRRNVFAIGLQKKKKRFFSFGKTGKEIELT